MGRNINLYKHMDAEDTVPFSMEDTAKILIKLNYGQQRMLAELVNQREADEIAQSYDSHRKHTAQLREMLENGWY